MDHKLEHNDIQCQLLSFADLKLGKKKMNFISHTFNATRRVTVSTE